MAGTTSGIVARKRGDDTDLIIFQGKTISFGFIWGGNTPVNVTGYSAILTLRESYTSTTPVAAFTVANSRVAVGTTNGLFTFSMTATDSAALAAGTGVYDIEIIEAGGARHQGGSGRYEIRPEVSQ